MVTLIWGIYLWANFIKHSLISSQYVLPLWLHNPLHPKWNVKKTQIRRNLSLTREAALGSARALLFLFQCSDYNLAYAQLLQNIQAPFLVYENRVYAQINPDFLPVLCLGNIYICWRSGVTVCLSSCAEYCCEVLSIFTIVTLFIHAFLLTLWRITASRD